MQTYKTYSLADLEGALRACNSAIVQTRRGCGGPILTLAELKSDAEALTALVGSAKARSGQSLSLKDIGELLPRLAYWHQRDTGTPPTSKEIIKAKGGVA